MDLLEYLKENNIIVNCEDITYVGKSIRTSGDGMNIFMEINIDEIVDDFPIDTSINKVYPSVLSRMINRTKKEMWDFFNSERLNVLKVLCKGGKIYPCFGNEYSSGPDAVYLLTAYLKKIKREHPEFNIPNIICQVFDYELDEEGQIFYEYREKMHQVMGYSSGILYIDMNGKTSILLNAIYKDKNNIGVNKKIEKNDINQVKKEIEYLKKYEAIIRWKRNENYVTIEFNYNNELIFFVNKEEVNINDIYDQCLKECKAVYAEKLKKANELCRINMFNAIRYQMAIESIDRINNNLDNYDKLKTTLSGRLKLSKKTNRVVFQKTNFYNPIDDFTKIKNKIDEFSTLLGNELLYSDLDKLMGKNEDINKFLDYIVSYFDFVNSNLAKTESYLKELEEKQRQIENQSGLRVLTNPKFFDRKPLEVNNVSETKEDKEQKNEEIDPFMDLQIKQAKELSKEDKKSLIIYKTILYRPINQILIKMRNGSVTDEEIDYIIMQSYDKLKNNHSTSILSSNSYEPDIGLYDKNRNLVEYNKFKKIILNSISQLEKALKKVTLDKPLTVYRGIRSDDIFKKETGFLSTTINSDTALYFLDNRYKENDFAVVFKIDLPKGSPVAFYSRELFMGEIDEELDAFADDQEEVLIDSNNYDFEIKDQKTILDANIRMGNNMVYLVEMDAHPKNMQLENEHSSKVR